MPRRILFLFSLLYISLVVHSQTATIRGFVYDKSNGEPVIFTNVYLKGTTYGGSTDIDGYFLISKIQPGKYTLTVSYIGYDTLYLPVDLKANALITQKLFLEKSSIRLDEFVVSAERQDRQTSVHTSIIKISPKQIEKLPSIGGQPDLAQYLQVVPGVVFTGDQGGQLYIRGGTPIHNKVILDGMVIYNPFHSIGFYSVFESEIIKNADIYTGGFNAEYGGRISSVMDITTRDGNKKRLSGKVSGNTFGSGLVLEGPIFKSKKANQPDISFITTFKTSYLDRTSKQLYPYVNADGLPFTYNDFYGKLSVNTSSGTKFNLFGFNFRDNVRHYNQVKDLHWNQNGFGMNIVAVPPGSEFLIRSNSSFSSYLITLETSDQKPHSSLINGFNVSNAFFYFLNPHELEYGIELLGYRTDFNYVNDINQTISQVDNTTEAAGYVRMKLNLGKILIEPGFRLQYYASLSEFSPEPRLGFKYLVTDRFRIKSSAGLYSQNLISSTSTRDVVNLFVGFLSGTENLQEKFGDRDVTTNLQKSAHLVGGIEYDLSNRLTANIEGYYKKNIQLTSLNRKKIFSDTYSNSQIPDMLKKDFIVEDGNAYGVDLLLKYDYRRINFWIVYSMGWVHNRAEAIDNQNKIVLQTYTPHFDRRHNINLVASFTFGEDLNWEVNARFNYGSGFPFTKIKGNYEMIPFTNIFFNYATANGDLGYIYADINTGRLPDYQRLDLSLKYTWVISENSRLESVLSITNAYNYQNMFYYDRIKHKKVYQLPFMPSLGVNFSF